MLRSSREGRKQAARYHTFQDKQNSDSISISYFYSNNNDGKANGSNQHKNKNDHIDLRQNSDYKDEERHNNETFISTRSTYSKPKKGVDENQKRIFSLNNKRKDDGSKRIENQVESRIKNKMNAISNWSDSLTISSTTSSSLGNQDVPIDTTPWSRETSLDSHSNGDAATSLSSPPSSRTTFDLNSTNQINEIEIQIRHPSTDKDDNDEEMYAEGESIQTPTKSSSKRTGWEEEVSDNTSYLVQPYSIDDDSSLSSLSDDSMEEEEDDDDQNSISSPRRISISPSPSTHTNQEDSIISQRPRRRISKTLKQVEAEESLALTPKKLGRFSIPSSGSSSKSMRVEKADEGKSKITEIISNNVDRIPLRSRRSDVLNKEKEDMMNDLSSNLSSDDGQSPIRKMGRPRGTTKEFLLQRAVTNRISLSPSRQQLSSSKSVSNSLNDNVDDKVKRRIPTSASHSALDNLRKTITQTESGSTSSTSIEHITTTTVQREQKENRPSWKRKVFLTSGLYSNDHKTNDGAKIPTKKSLLDSNNPLLQGTSRIRNSNRVSAFPLPTDFGHWVLTEKRDFRLPFPISQEIDEIRQKMALKRQPPPYKHISTNRYVSRPKLPGEIMICQCPPTGTCDENCVNRQTQYLCHPKHCPCGERCTNIQFGKRKSIKTEVHWYGARGFGLRTKEPIAKGAFIDEYRGEVVDYNEMVRRVRDHYKDTGNYYFLMYDAPAGEMLDGGLRGNITRFANHSCDPNCGIQKWLVCGTDEQRAGEFQVALFASRDIAAGEELTYDYGWSAFSPKSVTGEPGEACHCGATNCSGIMGVRKSATINKTSNTTGTSQTIQKKSKKNKRKRKVHSKTSKLIKQNDQLNVMQNLSNNVEEATQRNDTKYRKINLPQPLLSIIPAGYLDGNEIRVSTSILNKVKDDLKADVSNPLGRKRWEHAVALIIESHIQHAKEVVNKAAPPLPPIVDLKRPASENVEMVKEEEVMKTKRIKIVRSTITTVSAPVPTSESEIVINSTSDTEMTSSKDLIDSPTKKSSPPLSSTPLKKKEKSKQKTDITSSEEEKEKEKEREKSEEKKAVRTYVRDRVAMELVGAPANLIDDDFIPIMEGKRQRKVSQKFNETQEEALKRINLEKEKKESSSSSSSKPINFKSPKIGDQSWITIGDQSESLSSDIGNLSTTNIGDLSSLLPSDFQFDLSSYPEGTKFYLRTGEPYDFNVLNLTRRGKKPRPYTLEEIAEADERHRVNLKRLNDLRKFK